MTRPLSPELVWGGACNAFERLVEAHKIVESRIIADFFEADVAVSQLKTGMGNPYFIDKLHRCLTGFMLEIPAK